MNKFEQSFLIRRPRLGLFRAWDWLVEFFTGKPRHTIDKVTIVFLYEGETEPEVVLSGLYIVESKPTEKEIEEF